MTARRREPRPDLRRRDARARLWWLWPALLVGAGLATLALGSSQGCISVAGAKAGEAVCTTQLAPGAAVVAIICFVTAVVLAVVGYRQR